MSEGGMRTPLHLRLPATSANLGPGFDAAAVALDFYLEIEATPASEYSIAATGRNADLCGELRHNLIFESYKKILRRERRVAVPLALKMNNGIPLGMGCGSSAAGRVAAILMAVHFGGLDWSSERILEEAYLLEGHPDNAAACWLGGFVTAACEGRTVHSVRVVPPEDWRAFVVMPADPLPTSKARAVLPPQYAASDVVINIQSASLLGLAFAQNRGDLLRVATRDRVHQPYRAAICPLLQPLLVLAGSNGILSASLSGAGPSVLVVVEDEAHRAEAETAIRRAIGGIEAELIPSRFLPMGADVSFYGHGLQR
jgi:homoserine kinase